MDKTVKEDVSLILPDEKGGTPQRGMYRIIPAFHILISFL